MSQTTHHEEKIDLDEYLSIHSDQLQMLIRQLIKINGLELYKVISPGIDSRGMPYDCESYEVRFPKDTK